MSLDHGAFLRAIIDQPDDDLPRMVYADFLDEHGQPARAEFVRVQVELAKAAPECEAPAFTGRGVLNCAEWNARHPARDNWCEPCRSRAALRRRERELLDEFWAKWCHQAFDHVAPDVGVSSGGDNLRIWLYGRKPRQDQIGEFEATFSRGFVSAVTLSWADWVRHAAALLGSCPIARVNRPRKCERCGGSGYRGPTVADIPPIQERTGPDGLIERYVTRPAPLTRILERDCAACRGTGKADDWRGDGLVRLTTRPAVTDFGGDPGAARYGLTRPVLTNAELGSVFAWHRILDDAYPGVEFELPAAGGNALAELRRRAGTLPAAVDAARRATYQAILADAPEARP